MTRRTHAGSHPHCKAIANAYSVSCPVSLLTASFVILLTDAHSSRNLQKIERATFLRPGVDATGAVITDTRQLDRMCARSCYQRALAVGSPIGGSYNATYEQHVDPAVRDGGGSASCIASWRGYGERAVEWAAGATKSATAAALSRPAATGAQRRAAGVVRVAGTRG